MTRLTYGVIAMDPGKVGALACVVRYGETMTVQHVEACRDRPTERDAALLAGLARLDALGMHPMFVIEQPVGKAFTVRGIAMSVGAWRDSIERLGYARSRLVHVKPMRWRADLGLRVYDDAPGRMDSDRWKAAAERYCREVLGVTDPSPDACEAMAMGAWGVHAEDVARKAPRRRKGR